MSSNALQGKTTATAQDQLQINKFARLHKTYLEVKVSFSLACFPILRHFKRELARMNNDAQNLNDAEDELLLLDEADSASIPIQIGSIFVHYDQVRIFNFLNFIILFYFFFIFMCEKKNFTAAFVEFNFYIFYSILL